MMSHEPSGPRDPEDIVGIDMLDVDPLTLKKQISLVKWNRQPSINQDQIMSDPNQISSSSDINDMSHPDFWQDAIESS